MLNIQGSSVDRPHNVNTPLAAQQPLAIAAQQPVAKFIPINPSDSDIQSSRNVKVTSMEDAMTSIFESRVLEVAPTNEEGIRVPSSCVGNDGAAKIAAVLCKPMHQLEELLIWQNFIGASGTLKLTEAMQTVLGGRITNLDLSWNTEIGDEGASMIATALTSEHCMLTKLGLAACNVSDIGIEALSKALRGGARLREGEQEGEQGKEEGEQEQARTCLLKELSIYANDIGPAGATSLAATLKSSGCHLVKLNLSVNHIGDKGAVKLFESLRVGEGGSSSLTYLDLESNELTDTTATAIGSALQSTRCKLERLHLCNNKISDIGSKALSQGLCDESNVLRHLDLNKNQIGSVGIFELSKALASLDCRLERLYVYSNLFNEDERSSKEAAVALFGAVFDRVPTILKDLGGIQLSLGTTSPKFSKLMNADLLIMLRKRGMHRGGEKEGERERKEQEEERTGPVLRTRETLDSVITNK